MKTVTAAQMRALDRRAIEEYGIPGLLLMENAGRGVAELIFSATRKADPRVPAGAPASADFGGQTVEGRRVTVFAGKGNNGGDGMVAARHLHNRGFQVQVFLWSDPAGLKGDPALHYKILSAMKVPLRVFGEGTQAADIAPSLERTDIIVDALFGTGLEAPLAGVYREAVTAINQSGLNVVAVDIPSGLDADEGRVLGVVVKAGVTATLGIPKQGLFKGEGPRNAGRICVIDIGLPKEIFPR